MKTFENQQTYTNILLILVLNTICVEVGFCCRVAKLWSHIPEDSMQMLGSFKGRLTTKLFLDTLF